MQAGSFISSLHLPFLSLSLSSFAYNCNCYRRLSKRRLLWLGTAAHASLLTISLEASLESLGSAGSGNASSGFCCIIVRHSRATPRYSATPVVEASRYFGKEVEGSRNWDCDWHFVAALCCLLSIFCLPCCTLFHCTCTHFPLPLFSNSSPLL